MEKTRLTPLIMACLLSSVTEANCNFGYDEKGCVSNLTCPTIDNEIIPQKRVFSIFYSNHGVEEIVAECDWVTFGSFGCDVAEGYTCGAQQGNIFSLKIDTQAKCLSDGAFLFDIAHNVPILCTVPNGPNNKEDIASPDTDLTRENRSSGNNCPDEDHCHFVYDESGCVSDVTCCAIDDKIPREKSVFNISYKHQEWEEVVAECDLERSGSDYCKMADNYAIDSQRSKTFSVSFQPRGKGLTKGEFQFYDAHGTHFSCKIIKGTNKTRVERSVRENCQQPLREGNPENFQHEDDVNHLATWLGLGTVALVAVAVVAAVFNRNRLKSVTLRKRWNDVIVGKDGRQNGSTET